MVGAHSNDPPAPTVVGPRRLAPAWFVLCRTVLSTVGMVYGITLLFRPSGGLVGTVSQEVWIGTVVLAALVWLLSEAKALRLERTRRLDDRKEWLRDPGDTPRLTGHERMRSAFAVMGVFGLWVWAVQAALAAGLPEPPVWPLLLVFLGLGLSFHVLERHYQR